MLYSFFFPAPAWSKLQSGGAGGAAEETGGDVSVGGVQWQQVCQVSTYYQYQVIGLQPGVGHGENPIRFNTELNVLFFCDYFQGLPREWRDQNRENVQLQWVLLCCIYCIYIFVCSNEPQCAKLPLAIHFFNYSSPQTQNGNLIWSTAGTSIRK